MTSKKPHLILFGFPAAGKTTLGRHLASTHQIPHLDIDQLVENQMGCTRKEVPLEEFRLAENSVIAELSKEPPSVISLGGGTLLVEKNNKILMTKNKLVYLHIDQNLLHERWEAGLLPWFVKNKKEFYQKRLEHYQSIHADKLDMTTLSLDEAAKKLFILWNR